MDLTLSVDDEVFRRAEIRAHELGTTVDQLVRNYLKTLVDEFEILSRLSNGDSQRWKFNRDEIHERR